jgi:hypothetical protein
MNEQVFEASMNFDLEHINVLLRRITSLLSAGFNESDAATIATLTESMDVGEEREFSFEVIHDGQPSQMLVRIFLDDADAPDVYFFGSKDLIRRVDFEMERYGEELGI